METTRLSSKGQIIRPKSICNARNWPGGTEFEIEERPEGILLRPKKPFATTELGEVIGCTGYRGPAKSLSEMEEAIAQSVS